jgi:hypothetical protein
MAALHNQITQVGVDAVQLQITVVIMTMHEYVRKLITTIIEEVIRAYQYGTTAQPSHRFLRHCTVPVQNSDYK